jgi:glutaredoxin/glutathione-dependent peroxiredoxin
MTCVDPFDDAHGATADSPLEIATNLPFLVRAGATGPGVTSAGRGARSRGLSAAADLFETLAGSKKSMTIKVGDTIPSMKLMVATAEGPKEISTDEIFKGKKVVLFAVPGAFTPTCSVKHLPGFVESAEAFKAKGVDTIACIAVNDAFVMGAWGKDQGTGDKVTMLADGSAAFAKAIGLELDLNARGMGWRSQRYALIAEDGKVTHLGIEAPGGFEVSKAEAILAAL